MQNPSDSAPVVGSSSSMSEEDVPRALAAYGEGVELPPVQTPAERDAFEREQRKGWHTRSD